MRAILALAMMMFSLLLPVQAQDAPTAPEPWQEAITGQIEAFRSGDGATALSFAGAGFQASFTDPAAFYAAIIGTGYEPIVKSRSHVFGEFQRVNDTTVMQLVKLVGPDQKLFEAMYQMRQEPEGWRVQGVALRQEQGIGV